MYKVYKLRANDLDQRFLDMLKHQFQNREIEIVVSEAAEREEDETAYLLRSPSIASGCYERWKMSLKGGTWRS